MEKPILKLCGKLEVRKTASNAYRFNLSCGQKWRLCDMTQKTMSNSLFKPPKFYSTQMIYHTSILYALKNMAKIQGTLKYRLPHTIGKLRLSSCLWYQFWSHKIFFQNDGDLYEHFSVRNKLSRAITFFACQSQECVNDGEKQ